MSKERFQKLERKEGIKYIRCQHLKERSQKAEVAAWWLGESMRVIVCPICDKTHLGNMYSSLYRIVSEINEYQRNRDADKGVENVRTDTN